ncbi:MAG: cytochrome c-type biogenesis protein CcmH [Chloroflexi bacterium]|nr:MAG: cytochrome c-type biogenesis protein CcmH [Chloroflexota bacterium]MBL1194183.1 cytochrome c-type biogenesis protein CcmH [Chloroflexota bacterium]NOH11475.1 cytochrome c-type biogenesis protein CcmH [Chloroflexota bacterium]
MKSRLFLFVLLIALLLAVPVSAQDNPPPDAPTDDEINAVAKNMYCPVCENVPLDVCPTLACEQWRAQIRELLAEGATEQEVYDYFVLHYGDRVLAEPPRTGLNWLIYIVPPVVILAGIVALYFALRNWRKPVAAAPQSQAEKSGEPEDEYMARLEEELAKRN